jgi:hypothetical protein
MIVMPSITEPVSGKDVKALQMLLEVEYPGLVDLDLAMILNIPPMRINEIKYALPGVAAEDDSEDALELTETPDTSRSKRRIKPYHAILVRLLHKHPEYTPLVPKPSSIEVWEQIIPYMPKPARPSREPNNANRRGFGPLFGRSNVSSYKLLSEDAETATDNPGGSVSRLYMLVMGKMGQILRESLMNMIYRTAPATVVPEIKRKLLKDWRILHQEDELIETWVPAAERANFRQELFDQRRAWFDLYLNVLHDEAISRKFEPDVVIAKGNWANKDEVTDREIRLYEPRQRPILGKGSLELEDFKDRFFLTSSEFYWTLGLQIRAYYKARSETNKNRRIDAATSILLRYLHRYPKDISLFLHPTMKGEDILAKVQSIDPEFKTSQLGPLFGGAYVASYYFLKGDQIPYYARRMSSIMATFIETHPELYWHIRECAEEEAYARGVDPQTLWKEGRWSPAE